ncbi:hypothetical protein GCM10027590_13790 [Nocardiopsis nanhaiensis]
MVVRDRESFEMTAQACRDVGWEYRLVHEHDPALVANLRWLSGYRHPRHRLPAITHHFPVTLAQTEIGAITNGTRRFRPSWAGSTWLDTWSRSTPCTPSRTTCPGSSTPRRPTTSR